MLPFVQLYQADEDVSRFLYHLLKKRRNWNKVISEEFIETFLKAQYNAVYKGRPTESIQWEEFLKVVVL